MSNIKKCKISKSLLGSNIKEVSKPKDMFQLWKTSVDDSTIGIDNYELDFPEEMDPKKEQWTVAVEKPGDFYFLTESVTLAEACDAVKSHLKKHKKSLY